MRFDLFAERIAGFVGFIFCIVAIFAGIQSSIGNVRDSHRSRIRVVRRNNEYKAQSNNKYLFHFSPSQIVSSLQYARDLY
jgi:hypothetical protein